MIHITRATHGVLSVCCHGCARTLSHDAVTLSRVVQVSTAVLAAAVAVIVAFLTPALTSLRARRDAVSAKFDAALAALLLVQAARHYPTGMHYTRSDGLAHDNHALDQRLAEQCIEFFVESTAAAKSALVAIEPWRNASVRTRSSRY